MRIVCSIAFLLLTALLLTVAGCGRGLPGEIKPPPQGAALPRGEVRHVFIIVLENMNYASTFGAGAASGAPYLTDTLPKMGALLTQYHATGHVSLDNYISMVGGQSPNAATNSDCFVYADWQGTSTPDANGQVTGQGCVYPPAIKTIGNQLQDAGFSWKGYMEDMGNDLARDGRKTCSHPKLNAQDGTQAASATDQYATRHNPFMYFHSVIDDQANCDARVVPLPDLLADLRSSASTPNYVFIMPNLCNDGHDTGCANGDPGGLESINTFLEKWVPLITSSAAFGEDGLLIVTFDEASPSDGTACCNEPSGPNSAQPGIMGAGGGRIGAVLVSPLIKPGTVSDVPYNHYSMLRSVEDLFGLAHLGYAGQKDLAPFGDDIFTRH